MCDLDYTAAERPPADGGRRGQSVQIGLARQSDIQPLKPVGGGQQQCGGVAATVL